MRALFVAELSPRKNPALCLEIESSFESESTMANIYDEFIIVDEKLTSDLAIEKRCTSGSCNGYVCTHINSKFCDRTAFSELEFTECYGGFYIKDIASRSMDASGPLAQIVSWKWEGGTQKIHQNIILNRGESNGISFSYSPSIVIRILKKRQVTKNPCPPFSSPDDDLTVHIGDRQVTVSASWLMTVSPVVKRMLRVEMKEKQQQTLNLDGHDITMEQFMQFLESISLNALHGRTLPNPTNVLDLLALADYFQIDWLKERCEAHLINCVEIPLIERFLLIERYRLNNLKNFFLHRLNADKLKDFLRANNEQLSPSMSKEFWVELATRQ